jgi:DNA-binding transcriptional MerR regulator
MATNANYGIGRMAAAAGCKVQTVRYYEEIGLLPRAARSEGNQRRYGPEDARRLAFIRHARELGFPLPAIRELMSLSDRPERSCAAADAIARAEVVPTIWTSRGILMPCDRPLTRQVVW